ncbi:MAG TPA: D-alanine--D-alanine ligase [Bacteroidales bacterium]
MKNIAIVCGGYSGEYEISIASANVVSKNLDTKKYKPYLIVIQKKEWFLEDEKGEKHLVDKHDFSLNLAGKKIRFEGVFNAIHGTPGEDGKLQGYFDMLHLPYTSCNQATSALTFNKFFCNHFIQNLGLSVAKSFSFLEGEKINKTEIIETLKLPVFVKPAESGSSVGVSKVNKIEEFDKAVELAFKEGDRILIEEFIKGREIACGILKKGKEIIVFPLTEIISKKEFFDFEAKYNTTLADEITPADVNTEVEQDIKTLSAYLFHQLNCKGFVRFDYILTKEDLYFLEVNTIPGISEASIIPQMAESFGMTKTELFTIALDNLFED